MASRSACLCAFGFLAAAAVLSTQPQRRARPGASSGPPTPCDAGSLDNDAQICACNRENNGNIWALEMGTACESTC